MNYLLDTNTLIEAKNRYYSMKICPGFWDWIDRQFEAGALASISFVGDELKKGNDELAEWAKDHPDFFIDISDPNTQGAFGAVASYLTDEAPKMKKGALEDFLSGADPWLIAKAMTSSATVVTHEIYSPTLTRKFSIPNVCVQFGVSYMNTFELLEELEAEFILAN